MGTIGGNIANGSPIGDTPPPLIALGARLTLRRGDERRDDAARGLLHRLRQAGPAARRVRRERASCPCRPTGAQFAVLQDHQAPRRGHHRDAAAPSALTLDDDGTVGDGPHRLRRHGGDAEAGARGRGGAARQALDRGDRRGRDAGAATPTSSRSPTCGRSADYRLLAAKNLLRRFFCETTGTKAPVDRDAAGGGLMNKHAAPDLKAAHITGGVAHRPAPRFRAQARHRRAPSISTTCRSRRALLHGCLGLSTGAHAEIASIDLSAVRAAPGVVGVLTADGHSRRERHLARPAGTTSRCFADGKVQFHGQPIFAVIAETREAARRAARWRRSSIDELPHRRPTSPTATPPADKLVTAAADAEARRRRGGDRRGAAPAQGPDARSAARTISISKARSRWPFPARTTT